MRRLLLPLIVLLSGLAAACASNGRLPQSPLTAALGRKVGLIAYVGLDGNVYTIDQGGGHQSMLTDDAHPMENGVARFYQFPTWSAHDNRLAFIGREVHEDGTLESTVFATDADGELPIQIFASDEQHPIYLYWSPTAQWVSILTSSPGSELLAMQLAAADGSDTSIVDTGPQPFFWDWSPQGMEVMTHVGGEAALNPDGARLSRLQVDPELREIGLGIAPTRFQAPAYSPDGEYILLAGDGGGGQQQLMLTDANGVLQNTLIDYEGTVAFAWSPKGKVAAVLDGDPNSELIIGQLSFMDLREPTAPVTIETDADQVFGFFWAPNGKKLAYFVLVQASAAGDGGETGSDTPVYLLELHVADAKSGDTKRIWVFRPTQSFLDFLVYFGQYQRSTTIWSPDSNYLVIPAFSSSDAQGLAIVPASGNFEPRFLIEAGLGFWSWE